ncbi:hypothetical protein P7C73_g3681, partial [Tremellales sp. Uapishka_1]
MFGAAAIPGSRQGCFKEPGHESTNCPAPRSTDGKQCYACGGVGHVKADCPSMRAAGFGGAPGFGGPLGQKCYTCGRPGHIARMCPNAAGGFGGAGGFAGRGGFGGRGGFAGRPRVPTNPDGSPVKCYRCNGENHLARDCLAPRDDAAAIAGKKCYKCQELGHLARDCTKEAEELTTAE